MKRRDFGMAFLGAVVALLLTSCSAPLSHGRITAKEDRPAYTSTWFMPMTIGKTTTYIPMTSHHSESWHVTLHGCDKDGCRDEDHAVTHELFDQLQVHDDWSPPTK